MKQKSKKRFWNSEKLLSTAAIIASMGTMFVIIYQTSLIRTQQYASVLPYLEVWNSSPNDSSYSLILVNNGIGPAFIESIQIHYNDTVFALDPANFTDSIIAKREGLTPDFYYSNIIRGRLIPAGEMVSMVGISDNKKSAKVFKQWFGEQKAQVEIQYRSIYEERWKAKGLMKEPEKID
ncbi:hypothetical protein QWY31_13690 [Cytophagales bacterium LB-30]|uniref:Uncharacterized protein n=1 Tax=Shiella aurantiaca TaxID=3058365 RepID=A0ABT8F8M5_9BACT|nr:hypothetical protein [Shiella aurantiaca]MDN4166556.1 hypothetical protein [Shiella aurantiaca]